MKLSCFYYSTKAVTIDHFFLKLKGILLNKGLQIHMDDKKYNFEEKKDPAQNLLQDSTFSAFSKGQKSTSNFKKTPETEKMCYKMFFPNFLFLKKKFLM